MAAAWRQKAFLSDIRLPLLRFHLAPGKVADGDVPLWAYWNSLLSLGCYFFLLRREFMYVALLAVHAGIGEEPSFLMYKLSLEKLLFAETEASVRLLLPGWLRRCGG